MSRRITRDVEPADVDDLADHPPRAHLAVIEGDRTAVLPVVTLRRGEEQLVAVPAGAPDLGGREVHLVRDDGKFWFELRALAVRGVLRRADPDHDAARSVVAGSVLDVGLDPSLRWYVLDPGRTVAWDYGRLREAPDA